MTRKHLIQRIQDELGSRKLVWVGSRGHDAIGLMDIPQLAAVYAVTAPLGSLSIPVELALEKLSRYRVDLDTYSIDDDDSKEAREFRSNLLSTLSEPVAVVSYRPLALLSAISFPRAELVSYLGMFHERQATFEHKPWVESELRRLGVLVLPWRYFASEDHRRLQEEVRARSTLVLRTNRTDGGAGLTVVDDSVAIDGLIQECPGRFLAASPLLEPNIPLNAGACVFPNGTITLHPPSIQLIGIPECTNRRFGYCGNDFGAVKSLSPDLLQALELLTLKAGRWLYSQGYIGAYGVDALLHRGDIYLTEVNPRFQGSSALSARIDREMDRPDIFLCHLAAFLNLESPSPGQLQDLARNQATHAQILLHSKCSSPSLLVQLPQDRRIEIQIAANQDVAIAPNAVLLRCVIGMTVTEDGHAIDRSLRGCLQYAVTEDTKPELACGATAHA